MPQMSRWFTASAVGAVFLIAWAEFRRSGRYLGTPLSSRSSRSSPDRRRRISFWGSNRFDKLQELFAGPPDHTRRRQQPVNFLLARSPSRSRDHRSPARHSELIFI